MIISLVRNLLTFLCKVVRILMGVNNYTASLTIPEFRGVMQYDENESINTDMRYAADGGCFSIRDGTLLPVALPTDERTLTGRYYSGAVLRLVNNSSMTEKNIITATGEDTAQEKALTSFFGFTYGPVGAAGTLGTLGTRFSFAQYEYYDSDDSKTYDAMLLSNTTSGMQLVVLKTNSTMTFDPVTTPYNFGVIARFGERIWGTGIEDHPDVLCYSAPYDPTDWTQNVQIPEDGGGEIRQPTFDGEGFTALVPFGNSLLAFKEHSLWRITGLSPDEYTFQEQYGTGTIYPNTIVVYQEGVFFLTDRGVYRYDGVSVRPFQTQALRTLWKDLPLRSINPVIPTGIIWNNRYILSIPTLSTDTVNTDTVIYNFTEGTWEHGPTDLSATVYFEIANGLYFLQPGSGNTTKLRAWCGTVEETPASAVSDITTFNGFDWISPWSDMNCKDVLKHDFKLRFWIQTHNDLLDSGAAAGKLKLEVTVETERGEKTREMLFEQDSDTEILMRFHISGKKVRLKFKCRDENGNTTMNAWCRIMGGVQLNADVTPE